VRLLEKGAKIAWDMLPRVETGGELTIGCRASLRERSEPEEAEGCDEDAIAVAKFRV
jgi:hypothetical protein